MLPADRTPVPRRDLWVEARHAESTPVATAEIDDDPVILPRDLGRRFARWGAGALGWLVLVLTALACALALAHVAPAPPIGALHVAFAALGAALLAASRRGRTAIDRDW